MMDVHILKRQGDFTLDAAFALPAEGITGLVGPSGSGKSTLFSCLAGLTAPDEGHFTLAGRTLYDGAKRISLATVKRGIGVVFQDGLLFPHMSVRQNLVYGAKGDCGALLEELIDVLGLGSLLKCRPHSLSGGERQRVAIGRALIAEPQLLLLDEPVSALDPAMRGQVLDLIERVQARTGTPMIYISHAPEEIRRLATRVITLDRGRVAAVSTSPGPRTERAAPSIPEPLKWAV